MGVAIWTHWDCNLASVLAGMMQARQVCGPWQHHGQQQPAPWSAHPACAEGYHPSLQVGRLKRLASSRQLR